MASDSAGRLEISIVNAGIGESIVIHLPDGKWGVVDCYDSLSSSPTLRFLQERNVSELEFVCLTHPHRDHYLGMNRLMGEMSVRSFWQFDGMDSVRLRELVYFTEMGASRTGDEQDLAGASDLREVIKLVRKRHKDDPEYTTYIKLGTPVYPDSLLSGTGDGELEVWGLSPSDGHMSEYVERLSSSFTSTGQLKPGLPKLPHNMISVGLLIRFGSTQVILGGDVENGNWQQALRRFCSGRPDGLAADLVKVSHHGSKTACFPELWQALCHNGGTYAVVTPYNYFDLPDPDVIRTISDHASALMATSPPAIDMSSIIEDYGPIVAELVSTDADYGVITGDSTLGIWTFVFDDQGNCLDHSAEGAAVCLKASLVNCQDCGRRLRQ